MKSIKSVVNFVANFDDVKEHYTKEQFLDIMIDIMENTVIKNDLDFDMSQFSNLYRDLEGSEYNSLEEFQQDLHNCGTSCCMLGWAASDKRLMDKGLYLTYKGNINIKSVDPLNDFGHVGFYEDSLNTITGMSGDELSMLFGGDSSDRFDYLLNIFPEYEGVDYWDLKKILPKHFMSDADDPQDALDALRWYKERLNKASTSDSKSI